MSTAQQPMTVTIAAPAVKARRIRVARPDLRRMTIVIGLFAAQAVLALVMKSMQGIATGHAAASTIICVGLAATTRGWRRWLGPHATLLIVPHRTLPLLPLAPNRVLSV